MNSLLIGGGIVATIVVVIVVGEIWLGRKIAAATRGKAAKEVVDDITHGNAPVDLAERQRLRDKYKRP